MLNLGLEFDSSKYPINLHQKSTPEILSNLQTLKSFICYSFIMFLSSDKFNLQASRHGSDLFIAQCTIGIFTLCWKNRFLHLGGWDSSFCRRGGSNLIKDPKTPSGIICIIFIKPFSLDTQLNFNKHRAASYMLTQTARERERQTSTQRPQKHNFSCETMRALAIFIATLCPERWRRRAAGWH